MNDIWTIGHSTRTPENLTETLTSFQIQVVADVRRFPHSRRQPHFNTDELRKTLFRAGIRYEYLGDTLGGFRDKKPQRKHTGLIDSSFQGYADHMETATFQKGLQQLLGFAAASRTAYMCSESNFKSCHRRMISDALELLHGWTVHHIIDPGKEAPHQRTNVARVADGSLLYAERALDEFPEKSTRHETRG